MFNLRKAHRWMGALLILPFFAWAITGMIFFIKPGYGKAYASLTLQTLPLEPVSIPDYQGASQIRLLRTALGYSLFVSDKQGLRHLDPLTGQLKPKPNKEEFLKLLNPAIAADPERYGTVETVDGLTAVTSTGVKIKLNWNNLRFSQYGTDTKRIDWFYKVHYLQWSGNKEIDKFLGMAGLILLIGMALTGTRLLFSKRTNV